MWEKSVCDVVRDVHEGESVVCNEGGSVVEGEFGIMREREEVCM